MSEKQNPAEMLRMALQTTRGGRYPHIHVLSAYQIKKGYMFLANPMVGKSELYALFFFSSKFEKVTQSYFGEDQTLFGMVLEMKDIAQSLEAKILPLHEKFSQIETEAIKLTLFLANEQKKRTKKINFPMIVCDRIIKDVQTILLEQGVSVGTFLSEAWETFDTDSLWKISSLDEVSL